MVRSTMLAGAILALLLPFGPAKAAGTAHVSCRVVLPKEAIPGDPGYFITIEEVTIGQGDGHRLRHDPAAYYYVVSGAGSMSVDGKPDRSLMPGTVVAIPAGIVHQAHNPS